MLNGLKTILTRLGHILREQGTYVASSLDGALRAFPRRWNHTLPRVSWRARTSRHLIHVNDGSSIAPPQNVLDQERFSPLISHAYPKEARNMPSVRHRLSRQMPSLTLTRPSRRAASMNAPSWSSVRSYPGANLSIV